MGDRIAPLNRDLFSQKGSTQILYTDVISLFLLVDLFTPVQQHSMRCPRRKHYLLVVLIVFVLVLLYILFHLYHTL